MCMPYPYNRQNKPSPLSQQDIIYSHDKAQSFFLLNSLIFHLIRLWLWSLLI
ncbi:hypothetical protein BJX61DRAFT_520377 [Aspergillus egyptiacus]|nr:hypothetical protein BJX61DRAFT_520377 [Aspergillus egyptiacus]